MGRGERPVSRRTVVRELLNHPWTELVLLALIAASVILLVAETTYPPDSATRHMLAHFGDGITLLFAVELTGRFWVARSKRRFLRRYWLDLLAVLPLIRSFRLLRALRLLRIFRAGVLASRRMSVFGGLFRTAGPDLTILGSVAVTLVLAAAVVLFLVERNVNPDLAAMDEALWYSVFSLIAGEPIGAAPQTSGGRTITLVVMLGGLTVFGIFVGTISAAMATRLIRRRGGHEMDLDELTGHVIVCGWNRAGRSVLGELLADKRTIVVLITDSERPPDDVPDECHRTGRLYHLSGDHTRVDILKEANIGRASAAVLLADRVTRRPDQDRDARTVLAGLTIERIAPQVFTCAELTNRENASPLLMAGVDEIVVPHEYSGVILGSVSRTRGLVEVLDDILTTATGQAFHKIEIPSDQAPGATVGQLHQELKAKHNAILVSLERRGAGKKPEILVNPPADTPLQQGDRAVIISTDPGSWRRSPDEGP